MARRAGSRNKNESAITRDIKARVQSDPCKEARWSHGVVNESTQPPRHRPPLDLGPLCHRKALQDLLPLLLLILSQRALLSPIPFLFFLFRIRHPFHEIRPLNDAVLIEEEELDESRFQRRPLRLPLLPMTSSLTTSYDLSSLRDRTKDILSVVVALLFGVGSGALVAATMFLASSLFWNDYRSSSPYGDDSDEEEDLSPKKIGYVKILAAESESVPAPATT
ncbi:hypothetical protein FEM48_Zijuj04G0195200 [Ziziphus jujuba var. spinosa]|uniref:Transmembrane protein n=1 Tax=Ziziphus jujuba var. spinosa TaxID=714518 RepID=A0A978VLR9_ZIZJJ|nr:hypothetical protein FEM48_Zijuj04G0195200 [Ziziphus jujuba var. spinosa]